jgi:hypothetical protein
MLYKLLLIGLCSPQHVSLQRLVFVLLLCVIIPLLAW